MENKTVTMLIKTNIKLKQDLQQAIKVYNAKTGMSFNITSMLRMLIIEFIQKNQTK